MISKLLSPFNKSGKYNNTFTRIAKAKHRMEKGDRLDEYARGNS